jgi:cytidylate kinase/pantoate ligase/cytidylate kinase
MTYGIYRFMVITIDGPAGAGKSTAAAGLARRLGFQLLNTGRMYRTAAAWMIRHRISPSEIESRWKDAVVEWQEDDLKVDGELFLSSELSDASLGPAAIQVVASNRAMRESMVKLQRAWCEGKQVVSEGRDQGSVVFPDSPCKIFLTASVEERARRRFEELRRNGNDPSLEEIVAAIQQRDADDRQRAIGPLVQPVDARVVTTDGKSPEEVVEELVQVVCQALSRGMPAPE